MATNQRTGSKLPKWATKESAGMRFDSGPYVGIVKNNVDPTRSGRVQVWIPDLGGDENNVQNWRTLSYASPYFGSTFQPETSETNSFDQVQQTYGMWFVPPDIGNAVLCTFVAGDPGRGYWFACINTHLSHSMVPALGTSEFLNSETLSADAGDIKASLAETTMRPSKSTLPAAEFNENDEKNMGPGFMQNKKAIHEPQAKILINQGLDADPVRGAISSSSQRETPSNVFGISTPGRPIKDPMDDPDYTQKLMAGEIKESDYAVRGRKGGHTFVMDDGDYASGADQLIRLRTSGGHQILMNDAERIMYIANSDGSVWMEFAGTGQVNMYTGAGINIRTDGDFNLHADGNMNFHACGSMSMKAEKGFNVDTNSLMLKGSDKAVLYSGKIGIGSAGDITIDAGGKAGLTAGSALKMSGSRIDLNNGSGGSVPDPGSLKNWGHNDVTQRNGIWVVQPRALASIVSVAPSHEPWPRQKGYNGANGGENINQGPAPAKNVPPIDCTGGKSTTTSTAGTPPVAMDPGPAAAQGKSISNACPKEYLGRPDCPTPSGGIGPLGTQHVLAVMAVMAYSESGWKYDIANSIGFVGRYQFGAPALVDTGYIKRDYYTRNPRNSCTKDAGAWTGKNGCNSLGDWFTSKSAQESAMHELMSKNYSTMTRIGAIKSGDDLCTVAGMLCVSHLLGAGGANTWRKTGGGQDANGTTGEKYFNLGRYAVDVLANQGTNIQTAESKSGITGDTGTPAKTATNASTAAATTTSTAPTTSALTNNSGSSTKYTTSNAAYDQEMARLDAEEKAQIAKLATARTTAAEQRGYSMTSYAPPDTYQPIQTTSFAPVSSNTTPQTYDADIAEEEQRRLAQINKAREKLNQRYNG